MLVAAGTRHAPRIGPARKPDSFDSRVLQSENPMPYQTLTRDQHFQSPGPKRILALDGGGLRGIVSLGYLKRIETLLRRRHGDHPDFRLGHYFDLIAGTSTGAIIAAGLAIGLSVDELIEHYLNLGRQVFKASVWRNGLLRDRYDEAELIAELKQVFGDRLLGDASLCTGLLIVTKRMDTGSPWPLGNNPKGRYFAARAGSSSIANADYPLWQVVRASTAAPTFFAPEKITIARAAGKDTVKGEFVDGGVSPHNNPALQALMYATLDGFKVGWPTGEDQLLIVSVGTGASDPSKPSSKVVAKAGINALTSLMDDCATLVETLMQWLSNTPGANSIDREIGNLGNDLLAGKPSFSYRRYQLDLTRAGVDALMPGIPDKTLASLPEMDKPANLDLLKELGELAAAAVRNDHFPAAFDLPKPPAKDDTLKTYRRRDQTTVIAIPLNLEAKPEAEVGSKLFSYHKWDARQTCKRGDWLVHNGDDVYTVDRDTFARTYSEVAPGQYRKTAPVWAERAEKAGEIVTKEGSTRYKAGDYLVYNQADRKDGYAVSAKKFVELYEAID
jgi:predicted acylesterase/phospholipase RssA